MTTKERETPARERPKQLPVFDRQRCKRCGICAHFCPRGALERNAEGAPYVALPEACTSCRLCEHLCPDFAISMAAGEDYQQKRDAADSEPVVEGAACNLFTVCDE